MPELLERVRILMRTRRYSYETEKHYTRVLNQHRLGVKSPIDG